MCGGLKGYCYLAKIFYMHSVTIRNTFVNFMRIRIRTRRLAYKNQIAGGYRANGRTASVGRTEDCWRNDLARGLVLR